MTPLTDTVIFLQVKHEAFFEQINTVFKYEA